MLLAQNTKLIINPAHTKMMRFLRSSIKQSLFDFISK